MVKMNSFIFALGLIFCGCGKIDKSITDYELDGKSFTTNDLNMITTNTGIEFPPGSSGINLLYKGAFHGPNLLAKVEVPADREADTTSRWKKLPESNGGYDSNLTNGVKWWNEPKGRIIVDKLERRGRSFTHFIFSEQSNHLFFYIEWHY